MMLDRERAEEVRRLRRTHLRRMTLAVEEEHLFRAGAVVTETNGRADAIEEPRLGGFGGRGLANRRAASTATVKHCYATDEITEASPGPGRVPA